MRAGILTVVGALLFGPPAVGAHTAERASGGAGEWGNPMAATSVSESGFAAASDLAAARNGSVAREREVARNPHPLPPSPPPPLGAVGSGVVMTIAQLQYDGGGDWYGNPTGLPNLLSATTTAHRSAAQNGQYSAPT